MEPVGGGLRSPKTPVLWGGDYSPNKGELARWGGATRLTLDQKNQPDTSPGDRMQSIMDVGFPHPCPVFFLVNVVDAATTGAGIVWQTGVWIQFQIGVGRASTIVNQIIYPPFNPPPPGTYGLEQFFALGPPIPVEHITMQCRFIPGAINGETVDVFGAVSVMA